MSVDHGAVLLSRRFLQAVRGMGSAPADPIGDAKAARRQAVARRDAVHHGAVSPVAVHAFQGALPLRGGQQYRACFGAIPHYDRFISLMPRLFAPLMVLLHSLSGEQTGLYFADSTKLAVCHNRRIHRHKVFEGMAARGTTSMGKAGQRFRRRSRWKGQMRVVLPAQTALRHQPQRPDRGAENYPRQQSRQYRAG